MCWYMAIDFRWYDKDHIVQEIVQRARELDARYPESRLVAVGQSAAWIVDTVKQIRTMQGRAENCAMIPFTGNFMSRKHEFKNYQAIYEPIFTPKETVAWPHEKSVRDYFNHLSGHGCAPAQVVQDLKQDLPTVFIDLSEKGEGIASFATLYLQEAERAGLGDAIKEAISFYLYDDKGKFDAEKIMHLTDETGARYDMPVETFSLDWKNSFAIKAASGTQDIALLPQRLVPVYDLTSKNPKPQYTSEEAVHHDIRARLTSALRHG